MCSLCVALGNNGLKGYRRHIWDGRGCRLPGWTNHKCAIQIIHARIVRGNPAVEWVVIQFCLAVQVITGCLCFLYFWTSRCNTIQNMLPASSYLLNWRIEAYKEARTEALMKFYSN